MHLKVTVAGLRSWPPFIVVWKLGTDATLGTDFIDCQVEIIQVRKRACVLRVDVVVPKVSRLAPVPTQEETSDPKEVGRRKRAHQDLSVSPSGFPYPRDPRRWFPFLALYTYYVFCSYTSRFRKDGGFPWHTGSTRPDRVRPGGGCAGPTPDSLAGLKGPYTLEDTNL